MRYSTAPASFCSTLPGQAEEATTRAVTETANAEPTTRSPWAQKAARDLSVDAVLERIGRYAHTLEARAAIEATVPFASRPDAEREHTWVREALALVEQGAALPIRQTNDVTSVIQSLRASAVVSGAALFDCRLCLEQALLLTQHTTRHSNTCPTLGHALALRKDVADLVAPLRAALDESGQLFDHASNGLRAARSELSRAREVLRQEQAALVQRHKAQLSGAYFAEREGRFVLLLRADAERIDGTIFGASASGGTLYVEPAGAHQTQQPATAGWKRAFIKRSQRYRGPAQLACLANG